MTSKYSAATFWGGLACALAVSAGASAAEPAPRFKPLPPEAMTPAQKAEAQKAIDEGKYNPTGFDSILLRNPGLSAAFQGVAGEVYFGKDPADKPTLPHRLAEIGILFLAHEWQFPAMFKSHGPNAVKAGLSQEVVDSLQTGARPKTLKPDEAAVYDFVSELLRKRAVSDATFAKAREYLSERDVVDLVSTIGVYTNSLMLLKVTNNDRH